MMTDVRAEMTGPEDEDRLPWLEAVDEEEDSGGPSAAKLVAFVVVGLIAIGLIVGGLFWMRDRAGGGSGEPELIAAEPGDYKVKPGDPGGMKVEGEGDTAFAASEGAEPKSAIDVGAVPEAPVIAPPRAAPQAPRAAAAAPAAPAAEPPDATATSGGGGSIQLGAFSSQASAVNAWKALSARFKYLEPLDHSIIPVQSGGRTLYRLRAGGAEAKSLCGRLRVAGESCVEVN